MAANVKELILAFSKTAQSAIGTQASDLIRVNTVGQDMADFEPVVEDDADEVGKGHEFAEESFLVAFNATRKLDVYCSAELLAVACAFGLGSGTSNTFNPINPVTDTNEIELPTMTLAEAIRPTGTAVLNRTFLDMIVSKFSMDLKNGPGRANSKLVMDLVGSGKLGSAVTFPTSKTQCNYQLSNSLTATIHGVNYVTEKNFESFQFEWDNNPRLDSGYFPGSGFQTDGDSSSGAVRGRMEFGDRKLMCKFVTRLKATSTEFAKLTAQSAGTLAVGLSGANSTSVAIAMPQIKYKTNKLDNTDGIVTVEVDISAQVPSGSTVDDLVTFTINHTLGSVGRS
jgi:hypothetical protein